MTMVGVLLNLWDPLHHLPQPGYQRSTAEKEQNRYEKQNVKIR